MKTIHRFVLKSYLGPMILTFFIVMFILIMNFIYRWIEDLVGKGLGVSVIMELMGYVSIQIIPMALPLATLLAAIMTLGNMGENYELLAIKSAGVSLPKTIRPIAVLVFMLSTLSFFIQNNFVPYANRKVSMLISDIRNTKQVMEFRDGIFFNAIDDVSIRVEHQDPETKLLKGILIYNTKNSGSGDGLVSTTMADSGYIRMTDGSKFLHITLYKGVYYEQNRNYNWFDRSEFKRNEFDVQDMMFELGSGYSFERNEDQTIFRDRSVTLNINELSKSIDSLETASTEGARELSARFLQALTPYQKNLFSDSTHQYTTHSIDLRSDISALPVSRKNSIYEKADQRLEGMKANIEYQEFDSKSGTKDLYKYRMEWHKKFSLSVSVLIFLLIGAPFGALIRKGGFGLSVVVSLIFFVIYYVITLTGEKLVKEGTIPAFWGVWLSSIVLFPLAIFFTYKATTDSALFNFDSYTYTINKIKTAVKAFFLRRRKTGQNDNQGS